MNIDHGNHNNPIHISILKLPNILMWSSRMLYIETLPYLSVLNNRCVQRREFSDFEKYFPLKEAEKYSFPQIFYKA